jgi:hypothetical protein
MDWAEASCEACDWRRREERLDGIVGQDMPSKEVE